MSFFGAPSAPFGAAPGGAFGVPAAAPFGAAVPAAAPSSAGGLAPDGDVVLPIPAGTDSISTIQWSPNGQYLSAGTWDNKVLLYEVSRAGMGGPANGAVQRNQTPDLGAPILDHCWSPDGTTIYAAGCGKTIKAWNLGAAGSAPVDVGQHMAPIKHIFSVPGTNIIATGGWDKAVRYWDPRTKPGVAAMEVMMPERVYAMDVRGQTMVVGCGGAEKKLALLHMSNPGVVQRLQDSPLKFQTRCVRVFHDQRFFAVTSIEGRCAIRCVNEADDKATEPSNPSKSRFAFAFKCHRDDKYIYSVNAIDCQPKSQYHSVFATGGSDGVYTFWDKDKRQRLKEFPRGNRTPVVDVKYNPAGDLCAYAYSYDWSKGAENYNPQTMPPQIMVHTVKEDGELFRR